VVKDIIKTNVPMEIAIIIVVVIMEVFPQEQRTQVVVLTEYLSFPKPERGKQVTFWN